jgi:hypothetical protein
MELFLNMNGVWENEIKNRLEENGVKVNVKKKEDLDHVGVLHVYFEKFSGVRVLEKEMKESRIPFLVVCLKENNFSSNTVIDWVHRNQLENVEVHFPVRVKDLKGKDVNVDRLKNKVSCFTDLTLSKIAA